ncbi:MAG TPA: TlpA family protein disulfide reductase [Pricia antarctica]|uniref:TlpA family protein disulfide reductase n=2 Tax=root TaxID=1 RepID=A0A831QNB5_9FLAO|nr:TlpA family protein disulfide reductase [Pricia antarctica]
MEPKGIILSIICVLLLSCCAKKIGEVQINLDPNGRTDTIYVSELITENPVAELYPTSLTETAPINSPRVAKIYSKGEEFSYLIILAPDKDLNINIKPDSSLTTDSTSDSLVNYLWKSNLDFIDRNSALIFRSENMDSIPLIFEDFEEKREREINKFNDEFGPRVADLLSYQNQARIYAFLFWLGRVSKELEPENSYFDFIERIPGPTEALKSLPDIYLYKYEIEYLRKHRYLEDVPSFLRFIEDSTANDDLTDFLKAVYIRNLIEIPSYWQKHEKLFNTEVLTEVLESEKGNRYHHLIEKPSSSFYASQNGKEAYAFDAIDSSGGKFDFSETNGKVVFMDVWATWCGPCIKQRPRVVEFAKKYRDNDKVRIMMVSVDSSKDKWLSFLQKEKDNEGTDLFIEDGMHSEFGDGYNIKSIPRYILIGRDGKIIDANINEPSLATEDAIENAIGEN